jgi:hypothetical protein
MLVPQQPRDANGRIQTDIELPVSGDEPHNVITVDWVSRAICRLLENPESRDRTFHLVSEAPTTFRAVIDWCCEFFNSTGVRFVERSLGRRATSQFAEMFFSSSRVYQDYDACLVEFDNRNFKALVPDFPCPVISRDQVIRYLEFGAQDAWGKRRDQNPISLAAPSELAGRIAAKWTELLQSEGALQPDATYSLDIRGISGGQWHFVPGNSEGELVIKPGLCDQVAGHLVVDTNELLVAAGVSESTPAQQLQNSIAGFSIEEFVSRQHRQTLKSIASQPQVGSSAIAPSFR